MRGILTNNLKSDISGFREQANGKEVDFDFEPAVGERFQCLGEGVEFGIRVISTSPVIDVEFIPEDGGGEYNFKTESGSSYTLELC
jgi:hypothetical protein